MHDLEAIARAVRESDNFKSEIRYIARGAYAVAESPRLFKHLENELVRVVFPRPSPPSPRARSSRSSASTTSASATTSTPTRSAPGPA